MNKIFTCPEAAREHLESLLWPMGAVCPRCEGQSVTKLQGKSTRAGVYKCRPCRKPFTVTVGTVFQGSHIPLHKWLYGAHLMAASKKGVSAHQIHRMLSVTYKAAWFMAMRLREAMRTVDAAPLDGVVEMDSAQLGSRRAARPHVIAAAERGAGLRAVTAPGATATAVGGVINAHVAATAEVHTDEGQAFSAVGMLVEKHRRVNHSLAYVTDGVHTNNVEAFFSVLKRGLRGTYQHWSPYQTARYVDEFAFRYNQRTAVGVNDAMRAASLVKGVAGKRLTYAAVIEPKQVRA